MSIEELRQKAEKADMEKTENIKTYFENINERHEKDKVELGRLLKLSNNRERQEEEKQLLTEIETKAMNAANAVRDEFIKTHPGRIETETKRSIKNLLNNLK